MTSLAITNRNIGFLQPKDYQAITDDSKSLQKTSFSKRNYMQGSAADWMPTIEASLREIGNMCAKMNWDGEEAPPILKSTIELAETIVKNLYYMLPRGTPIPDLIPEADGEIAICWTAGAQSMFALSIGTHDKINFTGQYGKGESIHGVYTIDKTSKETFETSLEELVHQIKRL